MVRTGPPTKPRRKSSGHDAAMNVIRHLDNPVIGRRTLRDASFPRRFNHENNITLLHAARPDSFQNLSEACLVQEYMPQNLNQIIRKYEPGYPFGGIHNTRTVLPSTTRTPWRKYLPKSLRGVTESARPAGYLEYG